MQISAFAGMTVNIKELKGGQFARLSLVSF